ncbi:hypothetical protein Syun_003073 [Stephania yunnanensis]|uniref:Auxin response factor domain-containing protein n=1 Tax=Stephania yunnanensis TaxID=152371 RepID=A0AAP0L0M6_9MAGN
MAMESEDASRVASFHGAVSSVAVPDHGPFRGSPWRMLQVTWDEPAVLHNIKRVSPWQIELVEATPPYNPAKRLRVSNDHELLLDGQGLPMFPAEFANSMMGTLNFFHPNSSPAGMQGARHDTISVSDFSNFFIRNSRQVLPSDHVYGNTAPRLSSPSTDLHNINTSQSDNSSLCSESSVQLSDRRAGNSMTRAAVSSSIRLFGRVIHVNQPVDTGSDDGGGIKDDGGKQCDTADGFY